MTIKTPALDKALYTTNRAITLADIGINAGKHIKIENLTKDDLFTPDISIVGDDLLRSAIVISVAALDEYFTDKFSEMLLPFMKSKHKKGKDFYDLLSNAGIDIPEMLNLLSLHRPNKRIKNLVKNYLEKYTTQSLKQIDSLFLNYGIKDLSKHVAKKLKGHNILREMENLVQHRHRIVHEGDYDGYRRLIKLDKKRILKQMRGVYTFIAHAEMFLLPIQLKW